MRQAGEPVFLKPLPGGDFLPCLLTILHSIPACRKALLAHEHTLHDYGSSNHWWEGEAIETARIVTANEDIHCEMFLGLLHETQRLMAFLSNSSRSYGSAGALLHLPAMEMGGYDPKAFVRFMQAWDRARYSLASLDDSRTLFHSDMERVDGEQSIEPVFLSLQLQNPSANPAPSLYQALDAQIWNDQEEPFLFKRLAPVVVMEITKLVPSSPATIPKTWYADRYLMDNSEAVIEIRSEQAAIRSKVGGIEANLEKLQIALHPHDAGKTLSTSDLMRTTVACLETRHDEHNTGLSICQPECLL